MYWRTMLRRAQAQADRHSSSKHSLLDCYHKDLSVEFRYVLSSGGTRIGVASLSQRERRVRLIICLKRHCRSPVSGTKVRLF